MRAIAGAIVVLAGAMLMGVVAMGYVADATTVIQGPSHENQQHVLSVAEWTGFVLVVIGIALVVIDRIRPDWPKRP
jgi:protein-S-isoprenylcysteine O-methyltransferase Ste14